MSEKKRSMNWGHPVIVLGGATLLATLATISLWLFGQQVAAAVVGTATLFGWLALFGAIIAVVVSWWSASLIERGAQIALVAQTSDDKRDVAMISAISKLASWWRESQPGSQRALPMPSQQADEWMPGVSHFNSADIVDAEVRSEWSEKVKLD